MSDDSRASAMARYSEAMEGEEENDPVERLRFFLSIALHGLDWLDVEKFITDITTARASSEAEIARLRSEVGKWMDLEREAAQCVESVICMRTGFTGEEPYVGWKGLGIALREHLDKQEQQLSEANAKNAELMDQMGMMRKALKAGKDADAYCEKYHHLGPEAAENCAEAQQSAEELVEQAINATAETVQAYRAECDRNAKVEVLRDAQTIIADQLKSDGYAAFKILEQMASNLKHDEEQ